MKRLSVFMLACLLSNIMAFGANLTSAAYDLWHNSKYSMFIHFGLYSELGGVWQNQQVKKGYSEQIQSQAGIFSDSYAAVANRFNPSNFNADEIVALAKAAGMKSIVFTSKHHDGFCLFRTATTDFNSWEATPTPRDFVAELSEACAKGGLRFGLYFSLIDWHYPYGYPISSTNADPITPEHHMYNMKQVKELLSNYGPISELWFDMGSLTPDQSKELYKLVHKLQPDCMVSGRLGNDQYDFCVMGDNAFPDGTLKTEWQTPASMFSETWGYRSWQERGEVSDKVAEKIRSLLGVVSHGGNYLLNIGPKGDGSIVDFERDVLIQMGAWLDKNGDAIYGTEAFAWPEVDKWGFTTRKGKNIYVMPSKILSDTTVSIALLGTRLVSAEYLDNGEKAPVKVKGGKCYVSLPATSDKDLMRVICMTFDRSLAETSAPVINAKGGVSLTSRNAIADYSYSCFDYYTNYKSIVGYNWNISGVSGKKLEISYTAQNAGRDIIVTVDGHDYSVLLTGENVRSLGDCNAEWGDVYYAVQRSTSFSRNLPSRIYDLGVDSHEGQAMSLKWMPANATVLEKAIASNVLVARNVNVPAECDQVIEFAAGNGVEVLVNGKSVLKHLNSYKEENRHEFLRVHLNAGSNQILVGAFNKWAKQVPLFLGPAKNIVYTVTIPLDKSLAKSATHVIHVGLSEESNPHTDIGLSDIEIRVQ